ncbi:hypothetical protein BDF19DRAFT_421985 [Syncephalis fuscata]|nr:hypothetical protein BDF19DRAFT_421985 [Syncephalis fuscata]
MSARSQFLKGLAASGGIILVGYGFYKFTVPNQEQFMASLPEEVRERLAKQKDEQRHHRPAWEVHVYPTNNDTTTTTSNSK